MSPFLEAVATHCITHVVCCTNTFQREHPLQYHRVTAWLNTCQYYKQTSVSQNSGTVRGQAGLVCRTSAGYAIYVRMGVNGGKRIEKQGEARNAKIRRALLPAPAPQTTTPCRLLLLRRLLW